MARAAAAGAGQAQLPPIKETKRAAAAEVLDCLGREQTARVPQGQTLPVEVAAALVEVRGPQDRTKLCTVAVAFTISAVAGTGGHMAAAVESVPTLMELTVTALSALSGPATPEHSHQHA